ncbi:MAG: hypothetical protein NW223_11285 [Hyphomicrobiaceae bacterium]|nr:hypothetical protein [Hyphomicrobiaceae bacterium]
MFDFGRFGEIVGGLFGGARQEIAGSGEIIEVLERAGIDPASLTGLDQAQILELLAQHGVDASVLENLDIAALGEALGQGEALQSLADVISRVTQR